MIPDDRAQTETLGFIIIFSVIVISIGIVFTSGVTDLDDDREAVAFDNTERAMQILASNVQDIYKHGAPSRATEIKLYENTIAVRGSTLLNVTIRNTTSGTQDSYGPFTTKSLVYESKRGTMAYELGAVVRNQENGASFVRGEPPISFSNESVVFTHIQMEGTQNLVSNSNTVLVVTDQRFVRLKRNIGPSPTDDLEVTVRIETTPGRASGWARYFENEGLDRVTSETDVSNGVVVYRYDDLTRRVVVRQAVVDVSLEQ